MSKQGLRTRQDILDFTNGADFLSANGGGHPDKLGIRALLEEDLERGLDPHLGGPSRSAR
jgi:hypothetical protein